MLILDVKKGTPENRTERRYPAAVVAPGDGLTLASTMTP